jgi:hypothetical protein
VVIGRSSWWCSVELVAFVFDEHDAEQLHLHCLVLGLRRVGLAVIYSLEALDHGGVTPVMRA